MVGGSMLTNFKINLSVNIHKPCIFVLMIVRDGKLYQFLSSIFFIHKVRVSHRFNFMSNSTYDQNICYYFCSCCSIIHLANSVLLSDTIPFKENLLWVTSSLIAFNVVLNLLFTFKGGISLFSVRQTLNFPK